MPPAELLREARTMLDAGDARGAFARLRPVLEYPGREATCDVVRLFAEVARALAGEELARAIRATKDDGPKQLYDAGYALIDAGLPAIAATFLGRANDRYPGSYGIVTELVAALEGHGQHAEAVRVLGATPPAVADRFFCRYLLAFNSLALGDLAAARAVVATLAPGEQRNDRFMYDAIVGMVSRADALLGSARAVALDERDLRGWHFVMNGTFLLHESPYGRDEGMNGRYAFVQDSEARCVEGIQKILALLGALRIPVERVLALPDRDSRVLAGATARIAGAKLVPWEAHDDGPALICGYDLDGSGMADGGTWLRDHRLGQVLWTQVACWTDPFPYALDATTYLYQTNRSPWGERLTATGSCPPDDRPDDVLIAELAAATPEAGALDDRPDILAIARAAAPLARPGKPGALRGTGQRVRNHSASPVRSNRFA